MSDARTALRIKTFEAYHQVFKSPAGQLVLDDLKEFACYNRSTFSKKSHEMARNEGRRELVLLILSILDIKSSDEWLKMVQPKPSPEEEEF